MSQQPLHNLLSPSVRLSVHRISICINKFIIRAPRRGIITVITCSKHNRKHTASAINPPAFPLQVPLKVDNSHPSEGRYGHVMGYYQQTDQAEWQAMAGLLGSMPLRGT